MFKDSKLVNALEEWMDTGGSLKKLMREFGAGKPSGLDAEIIIAALGYLQEHPELEDDPANQSPLNTLAALFENPQDKAAAQVFRIEGLPMLRAEIRKRLDRRGDHQEETLSILKVLALYGQSENAALIVEAARASVGAESYLWSVIFTRLRKLVPLATLVLDGLRTPLPEGILGRLYLQFANNLAIEKKLELHPFASEEGIARLQRYLETDKDYLYPYLATVALPFIPAAARARLLPLAMGHVEIPIRLEAAWVRARTADPEGFRTLAELALDYRYSSTACGYLKELEASDKIPAAALEPGFHAKAEMADWLAHPNELGRLPDAFEQIDTRELFWPPTNDRRHVWIFQYTSLDPEGVKEPEIGKCMYGSVPWALFSETSAMMNAEDVYALHCCLELKWNKDPRAPKERGVEAGRAILAEYNDGF